MNIMNDLALSIVQNSSYKLLSNEVYIEGDNPSFIIATIALHSVLPDDISYPNQFPIKKFSSFEEAQIYCDVCSLKIITKKQFQDKYMKYQSLNVLKQYSPCDLDFTLMYPHQMKTKHDHSIYDTTPSIC